MATRKRSIVNPELSTVKSLNPATTDSLWIPAQQTTDDAVVKVSITQLGGDISSKIDHQGTYNRGALDAHPQYTLTSSFNQFQNQVNDDINDLQDDIVDVVSNLNAVSDKVNAVSSSFYPLSASFVKVSSSFVAVSSSFNTLSSSLAGEYLKLNGTNSPTADINWADNNITNIRGLYCENYDLVVQSVEPVYVQSTANFVDIYSMGGAGTISASANQNITAGGNVVITSNNAEKIRTRDDGIVLSRSIILNTDHAKICVGENDGGDLIQWDGASWVMWADGSDFMYMDDQSVSISPAVTFGNTVTINGSAYGAPYYFDGTNYGYPDNRIYNSSSWTGARPKALGFSDFTGFNTSVKWTAAKYEDGIPLTEHGTVGYNTPASTNYRTRQNFGVYWTSATAGNSAGAYAVNDMVYMGNAWAWHARVVPNYNNTSLQRAFFGLYGTKTSIGNVQPSSLTNILGFGYDSTDTNLQFMYNDAAGSATKVNTGFSARTTTMMLDLYMYCNGAGSVRVKVQRLDADGDFQGSTYTSNIPSTTTFLNPQIWVNNTTTAAAAYVGVQKIALETI